MLKAGAFVLILALLLITVKATGQAAGKGFVMVGDNTARNVLFVIGTFSTISECHSFLGLMQAHRLGVGVGYGPSGSRNYAVIQTDTLKCEAKP